MSSGSETPTCPSKPLILCIDKLLVVCLKMANTLIEEEFNKGKKAFLALKITRKLKLTINYNKIEP